MHTNIPLLFRIWQYFDFDTSHGKQLRLDILNYYLFLREHFPIKTWYADIILLLGAFFGNVYSALEYAS